MQDDESEASHRRLAYLPALDGVRAFAVLAVMMFHGGFSFFTGGFMGVDVFFVLSGFLITSLLVGEWRESLTIRLGAFWARRARRLLPALLLMLLFVAFFASVIVPKGTYGALRLDALSTLLYVSNWHFILVGSNYFNETVLGIAADPHLVARGGGAVLPGVAARRPRAPAPDTAPGAALPAELRRRGRLGASGCTCCRAMQCRSTGCTWERTPARNASSSAARSPSASCCSPSAATPPVAWPRASCGGRPVRGAACSAPSPASSARRLR